MRQASIHSLFLATVLIATPLLAAEPLKVLVLPFQVNAGPEFHSLKRALPEMLSARLTSGQRIAVVDDPRIERIAGDQTSTIKQATELGKALGAVWLIIGALTKVGENLSFDVLIVSLTEQGRQKSAVVEGRGMDSIIPKVTELAQSIHTTLVGEPLL